MNSQSVKVLYIEDDAANQVLVRKLLKAQGFEVLVADNGISGIDLAIEAVPDLILMDMNMPGLDGYEASTRLKNTPGLNDIPIIAVTANVSAGDRERSLVAGCNGYITKPIDPDTFAADILQYLDGKQEHLAINEEKVLLKEYSDKLVGRLEFKIRELSAALTLSQEVSQLKSEFLATISHELLTPLNSIIGFSDIMLDDIELSPQDRLAYTDNIRQSGQNLLNLVKQILEYTAIEAGNVKLDLQSVVLADVISSIASDFTKKLASKGMKLTIEIDPEIHNAKVDITYLSKVIYSILTNALKFSENSEIIIRGVVISARSDFIPDDVKEKMPSKKDYALISISDSGPGIAQADITKVFEAFRQIDGSTTRKHGGLGLGMACAKQYVNMHGGEIWVDSEKNKGTEFCFTLPLVPQ